MMSTAANNGVQSNGDERLEREAEEFFANNPPPAHLAEYEAQLAEFVSLHDAKGSPIVLVSVRVE